MFMVCMRLLEFLDKRLTVYNPYASFCSAFLEKSTSSHSSRGFMPEPESKKLIFRLGEIGFVLELTAVVEVVEHLADSLDSSCSDLGRDIVSALLFRQALIPVVDPTLKLNIISPVELKDKIAIVLRSTEGNWALLVDKVEKMVVAKSFQPCEFPYLLRIATAGIYSQVKLFAGEPLVVFDPERYYGAVSIGQS